MNMEKLNLCEILKGHEGKIFYSTLFGDVLFKKIDTRTEVFIKPICTPDGNFMSDGRFQPGGECVFFPSKDQRDWNKWAEEQKLKTPKTWQELIKTGKVQKLWCQIELYERVDGVNIDKSNTGIGSPIERSALALMKIHQLIEIGYGGNITDEEWSKDTFKYVITCYNNKIYKKEIRVSTKCHIAFHAFEQRKEFMSYPENAQLVKDFYMIK